MPPVSELTFKRAFINLQDAGRLGEGEDLNDALLDFFMRLGQTLIPKGGEAEAPVSYLGAIFWKQLRSAFATSGEEGWKNVQNWGKRKAGGMFKGNWGAFAVPINEDLKDDKGNDAGNHWWLALVLNPPGGANMEPTAVMCIDSMQRRTKKFSPPVVSGVVGSRNKYTLEVTEVEQAGYLVIISFTARGDGSLGPMPRPETSTLKVDGYVCTDPTLGLRVNNGGGHGVQGWFEGTLTFAMDGKCRTSTFVFEYSGEGYTPVTLEFDPFALTKLQKDVSRYLGGYLAKEWDQNGPSKKQRFEKQSARALVADVHQQENLNDCGVFALENSLRALSMKKEFLKAMAEATPKVLKTFPWPTQQDITTRKLKMKAIVARLFSAAAEKGTNDVEKLLKDDAALKAEVLKSLTDDDQAGEGSKGTLDQWSDKFQQELGKRQQDKENAEKELKKKEEAVQGRRDQERAKREEDDRRALEDRREGRGPNQSKVKRPHQKLSRSISHKRSRERTTRAKYTWQEKDEKKKKGKGSSSASEDESASDDRNAKNKKKQPPPRRASPPPKKDTRKDKRCASDSQSDSRSASPPPAKRRR